MKKLLLIFTSFLISSFAFAQKCTDADLENVPGVWTSGIKGSVGLSGAEIVKAKSVTEIVDNMMRPNFQVPKGLVATYFSAFVGYNQYIGNNLAQYDYTNWFNHFMCYNDKVTKNPDSQIILRINFKDPGVVFSRDVLAGEWEENEKDHFGWLDNFPEQKNGIVYMKSTPDSAQFTYKPDRWLITYDGKLPYTFVTRFEYLQKLKEKLTKSFQKNIDDIKEYNPIRPKVEQEKEKEEALQKFKDEAAQGYGDWTNRYLQSYKTDEQKQEENIKSATETYQKSFQIVENLLKMPEKDLQKPAIVNSLGEFSGFSNEGEVGAHIIIKENPDYYNNKLAKGIPQVIFVSLTRYSGSGKQTYVTAYNSIIDRLDFEKLKALLGK
ncbi:MAG: hypothetical protein KDD03_03790 [Gelidibacter sp.]|nr:hypothetical protein [Gelidibacter sp.]